MLDIETYPFESSYKIHNNENTSLLLRTTSFLSFYSIYFGYKPQQSEDLFHKIPLSVLRAFALVAWFTKNSIGFS